MRSVAQYCAPGTPCAGAPPEHGCADEEKRRQTRCRQIDEIIEPSGGESEIPMARSSMADHAVGGVDCLVGGSPGKPAQRQPEHRRDDAVGKIFGEALD